jgi:hypothetical protein
MNLSNGILCGCYSIIYIPLLIYELTYVWPLKKSSQLPILIIGNFLFLVGLFLNVLLPWLGTVFFVGVHGVGITKMTRDARKSVEKQDKGDLKNNNSN